MSESNLNEIIEDTEQLIFGINDKLLGDDWKNCKTTVIVIINKLGSIFDICSGIIRDDLLEIQNTMFSVIDSLVKAVEFEDSIQIADLLGTDIVKLLEEIRKLDIK